MNRLTGKVAKGVEEVRDRATDALGEGESVFRAIGRLGDRIEATEQNLDSRIATAEETLAEAMAAVSTGNRTTWPRRMFWLALGISAGVGFLVSFPDKVKEIRAKVMG